MQAKKRRLLSRPAEPVFDARGIAVIESHHAGNYVMDWREDPYTKILAITAGDGVLSLEGERLILAAPRVAIVPRGIRHRIEDASKNPISLYVLCLKTGNFPPRSLMQRLNERCVVFSAPYLVGSCMGLLRRLLYECRKATPESETMRMILAAEIGVILIRTRPGVAEGPAKSAKMLAYLDELARSFWTNESMDEVAGRLGMSRRTFSTTFRSVTGKSWHEHRQTLRLAHARELLTETNIPIKAVAFECGYDDLAHFYRTFATFFGRPPGAWREMSLPSPDSSNGRKSKREEAVPE